MQQFDPRRGTVAPAGKQLRTGPICDPILAQQWNADRLANPVGEQLSLKLMNRAAGRVPWTWCSFWSARTARRARSGCCQVGTAGNLTRALSLTGAIVSSVM